MGHSERYEYDHSHQITHFSFYYDQQRFIYDPAANLLNENGELSQANRLTRYHGYHYRYDSFGRLIERDKPTEYLKQRFSYNSEDKLIEANVESLRHRSTTCYQYHALGRRTEKTTIHYDKYDKKQTAETISFDWQGLRLSGEKTSVHPTQQVNYIYNEASYEPVARVIIHTSQNTHAQTEQLEYFHTLQSSLPTELTNVEGEIIWQADYRLFGELKVQRRRSHELYQQNLRFAGQYYDNETGLHYNTFRYYDPNCGRFTQQDPIGLAGGINLYQYAPNPLGWIDLFWVGMCS